MSEQRVFLRFWGEYDVKNFGGRREGGINFPVTGFPQDMENDSEVIIPFWDGCEVHGEVFDCIEWKDGIVFDIRVDFGKGKLPTLTYDFELEPGVDIDLISKRVIEYKDTDLPVS